MMMMMMMDETNKQKIKIGRDGWSIPTSAPIINWGEVFAAAQAEIFTVMERDIFKRFLNSRREPSMTKATTAAVTKIGMRTKTITLTTSEHLPISTIATNTPVNFAPSPPLLISRDTV